MKTKYLILLGTMHPVFSMMQTNSNVMSSKTYKTQMLETMRQQGMTQEQIDMAMAMSSMHQQQDMQQKLQSENNAEEVENLEENDVNLTDQMKTDAKALADQMKTETKAQAKEQLNEATKEAKETAKEEIKDTIIDCFADICVVM